MCEQKLRVVELLRRDQRPFISTALSRRSLGEGGYLNFSTFLFANPSSPNRAVLRFG